MPFGAVQLIATLGGAWLATKYKTKGGVIALLCLPAIAGCVMLLEIPRGGAHKGPLLAGYYIVSLLQPRAEHTTNSTADFGVPWNQYVRTNMSYGTTNMMYPAPMIYSWAAANTAGETKKKAVNGILLVGQCAGNVCMQKRRPE